MDAIAGGGSDGFPVCVGSAGMIAHTKDRPVLLTQALRSVVTQTFDDWILAVVNDGDAVVPVDARVEV